MSLYEVLKFLHIICAIIWVGGAVITQVDAARVIATDDGDKMADFAGQAQWISTRVFMPASGVLVLLGVWMVFIASAWSFGQTWVLLALAAFAYSFISGAAFLGPESGRIKKLTAEKGPSDPEVKARIARILKFSRIELVVLILIVLDMVVKPGL